MCIKQIINKYKRNEIKERINKLASARSLGLCLIDDKLREGISNFLILWNIFENELYNSDYSNERKNSREVYPVLSLNLHESKVDLIYNYIRNRYKNHPKRIDGLNFRNRQFDDNDKNFLVSSMNQNTPDVQTKLKCILIVVYRYRCSLFHGDKVISNENHKIQNLSNANAFLLECLEAKFQINNIKP